MIKSRQNEFCGATSQELSQVQLTYPFLITFNEVTLHSFIKKPSQWTTLQRQNLSIFLRQNSMEIQKHGSKKPWNIYIKMAAFIQTRNFRQCKSYFERLLRKKQSLQKVIDSLEDEIAQMVEACQRSISQKCQEEVQNSQKGNSDDGFQISLKEKEDKIVTDLKYPGQEQEGYNINSKRLIDKIEGRLNKDEWKKERQLDKWIECQNLYEKWTGSLRQLVKQCRK